MKPSRLAFACVLLAASAIVPTAALAQTSAPSTATPSGAAPSATAPSAPSETETSPPQGLAGGSADGGRSDVQEGWRSSREEERSRSGGRAGGWDRDEDPPDMRGPGRQDRMYGRADDSGPDWRARMRRAHRGMTGPDGTAYGDGMPMRMVGRAHRRHHMSHQTRGARLELKRGDSSMRIHCPADEPIAACVEAVSKLVDKLQSLHQTRAP